MIRIGHFGILTELQLKEALDHLEHVMVELGAAKAVQPASHR
jgi:aspartate aminotransferase-like enzyme